MRDNETPTHFEYSNKLDIKESNEKLREVEFELEIEFLRCNIHIFKT